MTISSHSFQLDKIALSCTLDREEVRPYSVLCVKRCGSTRCPKLNEIKGLEVKIV